MIGRRIGDHRNRAIGKRPIKERVKNRFDALKAGWAKGPLHISAGIERVAGRFMVPKIDAAASGSFQ